MNPIDHATLITPLIETAREAGARILAVADRSARKKADHSPITEADMAAHHYIVGALAEAFPHIPVVSEEDAEAKRMSATDIFFLVDPLDGTRSFVRGEDEYTVNIGLIEQARPTFGVIYAPARGVLYYGGPGLGAFRRKDGSAAEAIYTRSAPAEGLTVTRSRAAPKEATKQLLASLPVAQIIPSSSSIKLCWVAEGTADIYPRFGRTMEWDIAAGQAILEAAGGSVKSPEGMTLYYAKPGFVNHAFIARGKS